MLRFEVYYMMEFVFFSIHSYANNIMIYILLLFIKPLKYFYLVIIVSPSLCFQWFN